MRDAAAFFLGIGLIFCCGVVRAHPPARCSSDDFISGGPTDVNGALPSGAIGSLGWSTDAGVIPNRGDKDHPGVVLMGGQATMKHLRLYPALNPAVNWGIVNADTPFDMTWVLRRSTTQQPAVHRVGFFDVMTNDPAANGMYFEVRGAEPDRFWWVVTRSGGTSQAIQTPAHENSDFQSLRIQREVMSLNYYIDDQLVATHSSGLPSAATFFNVGIQLQGPGNVLVDYFSICFRDLKRHRQGPLSARK